MGLGHNCENQPTSFLLEKQAVVVPVSILSCEFHPLELDLNKTERGVIKHPTLVLFV